MEEPKVVIFRVHDQPKDLSVCWNVRVSPGSSHSENQRKNHVVQVGVVHVADGRVDRVRVLVVVLREDLVPVLGRVHHVVISDHGVGPRNRPLDDLAVRLHRPTLDGVVRGHPGGDGTWVGLGLEEEVVVSPGVVHELGRDEGELKKPDGLRDGAQLGVGDEPRLEAGNVILVLSDVLVNQVGNPLRVSSEVQDQVRLPTRQMDDLGDDRKVQVTVLGDGRSGDGELNEVLKSPRFQGHPELLTHRQKRKGLGGVKLEGEEHVREKVNPVQEVLVSLRGGLVPLDQVVDRVPLLRLQSFSVFEVKVVGLSTIKLVGTEGDVEVVDQSVAEMIDVISGVTEGSDDLRGELTSKTNVLDQMGLLRELKVILPVEHGLSERVDADLVDDEGSGFAPVPRDPDGVLVDLLHVGGGDGQEGSDSPRQGSDHRSFGHFCVF